jgi:hypothetical protein
MRNRRWFPNPWGYRFVDREPNDTDYRDTRNAAEHPARIFHVWKGDSQPDYPLYPDATRGPVG